MTAKATLTVLLAVLSIGASAQDSRPEIWYGHPRIFFNSETWPQIKAEAMGPRKKTLEAPLKEADSFPDNPVAGNTGPVNQAVKGMPYQYNSL